MARYTLEVMLPTSRVHLRYAFRYQTSDPARAYGAYIAANARHTPCHKKRWSNH